MPTTPIVFRVDASTTMGTGHLMRCLALANSLRRRGADCLFLYRQHDLDPAPTIIHQGHRALRLPEPRWAQHLDHRSWLGVDQTTDIDQSRDALESAACRPAWICVDHYALDAQWEQALARLTGAAVLAIDDLADRPHQADLVLDQTLDCPPERYQGLLSAHSRLLPGTDYALLRPEFAAWRPWSRQRRRHQDNAGEDRPRILLSLGGTDPRNFNQLALDALEQLDKSCRVQLLIGAQAPALHELQRRVQDFPQQVDILTATDQMARLLYHTDLAIGAAGTSSWERCALGVPGILLVIAENQRQSALAQDRAGVARLLGDWTQVQSEDIRRSLQELLLNPAARQHIGERAAQACDGLGCMRVADLLVPITDKLGAGISLRPARMSDADLLLRWQSAPGARQYARDSRIPTPAEHRQWLQQTLDNPLRQLLIAEQCGHPLGTLRLDAHPEHQMQAEVSILSCPSAQGRGVAQAMLRLARICWPFWEIHAYVRRENQASQVLFERAGYQRLDAENFISHPLD